MSGSANRGIVQWGLWVCLIFLHVDRSLNEIYSPGPLLIKVFYKKCLFITASFMFAASP
jgi:hypothetical protein